MGIWGDHSLSLIHIYLAGGDELGYDVFARLLHGARVSLVVAAVAMMVSTGIGLVVGVTAGALGGIVDAALMRFTDALLAIPLLPLLLIASALDLSAILPNGPAASVVRMIGILSLFSWMSIARLARASVLQANALDYVLAARALGASRWHIAKTHLLSAAAPPVVVAATLEVGNHLLAEAALSFLGLGIQPPVPSWGNMLSHGLDAIKVDAALMALPGACILLTVTCVHWLGDGLREALDPRGSRP